jgi:hypothetical protein
MMSHRAAMPWFIIWPTPHSAEPHFTVSEALVLHKLQQRSTAHMLRRLKQFPERF